MNAAQALLREVRRDTLAFLALSKDLADAIDEELERAATTPPTHSPPMNHTDLGTAWKAGPVTGEQTMRRFGLVRDDDPFAVSRAALNAQIDAADEDD